MSMKRGIRSIRRMFTRWVYRCKHTYYEWIVRPRRYWQRAIRGWADDDTYNMDVTLAELIGGMLHFIAETDSSYPGRLPSRERDEEKQVSGGKEEPAWTHDTWKAYLHSLASAFDAYVMMHDDYDDSYCTKDSEQVLQRMRGLFDYYRYLWT